MTRRRIPDDAFDVYVALGDERSYQAIADRFGVSKRAVAKRAAKDDWQKRLKGIHEEAGAEADTRSGAALAEQQVRQARHTGELQQAMRDVVTPQRMKALVASLLKAAVQKEDVSAARLILDRVLGKPRNEPLPAVALDLPDGLETTSDVRAASNALLQGLTDGSLAPEDAQKAATVIEAARRCIETEELERRIRELEEQTKRRRRL